MHLNVENCSKSIDHMWENQTDIKMSFLECSERKYLQQDYDDIYNGIAKLLIYTENLLTQLKKLSEDTVANRFENSKVIGTEYLVF